MAHFHRNKREFGEKLVAIANFIVAHKADQTQQRSAGRPSKAKKTRLTIADALAQSSDIAIGTFDGDSETLSNHMPTQISLERKPTSPLSASPIARF